MTDVTGKSGVGKRILDEHGNWRTVTSLPKEVQKEIKASQKVAQNQFKEKALRHNKEYQDHKAKETEKNLKSENDELRELVKSQGEMLAKINAKMELGAAPTGSGETSSEVTSSGGDENKPDEPAPAPKPLTPKQKLQLEAEELGIDFEELHTKAELTEMISNYHIDSASHAEDEAAGEAALL